MSKVLYSATMSLDGFIAGAGGDMSWLGEHLVRSSPEIDELMAGIGALLVGKRTFTGDDPNRGTDAEGALSPPRRHPDVVFPGDLASAVEAAKRAAAGRYVNVLGDGTRLFERSGGTNVRLEPLDQGPVRQSALWFRVAR